MHDCCLSVYARECVGTLVVFTHVRQKRGLGTPSVIFSSNPPVLVRFPFGIAGYNAQPVTGCWDLNSRPYDYRVLLTIRPLTPWIFALLLTFAYPEQCHFEKLGAGFSVASM